MANATPVRVLGSCSFIYLRNNDVYIMAVTKNNANAMLTFQFMTNVWACSLFLQLVYMLEGILMALAAACCSHERSTADSCCFADRDALQVIFWRRVQRAEHQGQLCSHLRASRRDSGLWVSSGEVADAGPACTWLFAASAPSTRAAASPDVSSVIQQLE